MLEGISQAALIKFKEEYMAYVNKVADLNWGIASNRRNQPSSIKDCFKPSIL